MISNLAWLIPQVLHVILYDTVTKCLRYSNCMHDRYKKQFKEIHKGKCIDTILTFLTQCNDDDKKLLNHIITGHEISTIYVTLSSNN